jgi:hypothetical protein
MRDHPETERARYNRSVAMNRRFMVFTDWGLMLLNIEVRCVILLALYQKV